MTQLLEFGYTDFALNLTVVALTSNFENGITEEILNNIISETCR